MDSGKWMYIKSCAIFCCILIAISCENPKESRLKIVGVSATKIDSMDLRSFPQFVNVSTSIQPHGKEYVYFYMFENGTLFKLDLNTFKLDAINVFYKPYIVNFDIQDSLKLISLFTDDSLFTFDFSGNLLISKEIPSTNDGYLYSASTDFKPAIIDRDNYLFYFFPDYIDSYKDKRYFTYPLECHWNVSSNKIKMINVYYPHNYKVNFVGSKFVPERIRVGDKAFYTFAYNDSIIIYDYINQKTKLSFFGTNRELEFLAINFDSLGTYNESIADKLYLGNPNYFGTQYLSNKKIFTRRLLSKNPDEKNIIREWKLIFYNNEFKYLGETEKINFGLLLFETKTKIYSIKINPNTNHLIWYEVSIPF